MKFIGIDGCKIGWFLVGINDDGSGSFGVLESINELSEYLANAKSVLLDIPIGLRNEHAKERVCDKQARKLLGSGRGSSVFPAPSRCALNSDSYSTASDQNFRCTGRRLSQQTYAIIPKIKEVDEFMLKERPEQIHEMHPEVCFWAMNDGHSMKHNKKTREGFEERLTIMERFYPQARNIVELALAKYLRKDVA